MDTHGIPRSSQWRLDLAVDHHRRLTDTPAQADYLRGQRDAYLHAYAHTLTPAAAPPGPDPAVVDRVTAQLRSMLDDGITDPRTLVVTAQLVAENPAAMARRLSWVGPLAFERVTATRTGTDIDLGFDWGEGRDIRISCRRPLDATRGLLYAYNRTWDEYAILADDIDIGHVETAYRATTTGHGHPSLDAFILNLYLTRPTPQPAPHAAPSLGMVGP